MEVRHAVGLDEENAGMGSRLQDWKEPLFSCSEGPRGRKQLVGAAGADYGSLCVNLNMRPQVWGGREPVFCIPVRGPLSQEEGPGTRTRGSGPRLTLASPASWDPPVHGLQPQKFKLHQSGVQADVGDVLKPQGSSSVSVKVGTRSSRVCRWI